MSKANMKETYAIPCRVGVFRDMEGQGDKPVQIRYFNDVMVLFIRTLSKFYSQDSLTEEDKSNLRRYLNKMIEAKDAMAGTMRP
jgi:hypothetical protein